MLRALTWLIASATLAAGGAAASTPTRTPLLVDVPNGTLGTLRLGRPLLAFDLAWGPPDRVITAPPGGSAAAFATWHGPSRSSRAAVTFGDKTERRANSIFYAGPFRTVRGDRNGTTLARVLAHWPVHHGPNRIAALPGYVQVKVGRTVFVFNKKKRLVGVQFGSNAALTVVYH